MIRLGAVQHFAMNSQNDSWFLICCRSHKWETGLVKDRGDKKSKIKVLKQQKQRYKNSQFQRQAIVTKYKQRHSNSTNNKAFLFRKLETQNQDLEYHQFNSTKIHHSKTLRRTSGNQKQEIINYWPSMRDSFLLYRIHTPVQCQLQRRLSQQKSTSTGRR